MSKGPEAGSFKMLKDMCNKDSCMGNVMSVMPGNPASRACGFPTSPSAEVDASKLNGCDADCRPALCSIAKTCTPGHLDMPEDVVKQIQSDIATATKSCTCDA
jgi:hypothetical protein